MIADARRGRTTVLAFGLAALALTAAATTATLAVLNRARLPSLDAADPSAIIIPIGAGVLGALVASRRPRNPTGWLLLVIAVASGLQGAEDQYVRLALFAHGGALPGVVWAEWLNSLSTIPLFPAGAVALLMLLLPDGHLPSRRWRPVAVTGVIVTALLAVLTAFAPGPISVSSNVVNYTTLPNPVGLPALRDVAASGASLGGAIWFLGLAVVVCAAAAPLVRMRRSVGDERQQLKWIAYAVLTTVVAIVVFVFLSGSVLPGWTFDIPIVLGFGVAFPATIGIAIFKYRLYDIDVVISRTLVYGSLAVFITAVYVGIAVGIGAAIGGGGRPNLGLSILATAIVAVGFQPVRERVQKVANRLVYGKRATPYEVLSEFSARVADSYATDDVMPRMARVLAEGTGAQRADVWLRSGMAWREAAVWPADAIRAQDLQAAEGLLPPVNGASRLVEVRHQGELLGALSVTKRAGDGLTPVEDNLLTDLAGQAGLVLRNVGLTADLQARLDELRASRQRLVSAQDEERRRLERNLHDGAQQHLVALKVKLGLAEMLMGRDPDKARLTIDQLKSDADDALDTLRDLARGIYPPLLADRGLGAALEAQARKATVAVTVDADGLGRYSQDVEAAVYFSVLEALQNVQKYAGASHVQIHLDEVDGVLRFSVDDDGAGFDVAATRRGSGLVNMADRLDALGGRLQVSSTVGAGTSIAGRVSVYVAAAPLAADQASTSRSGLNSDLGMKQAAPTSSA
ncbi:MAG TPA: histidine kinase [Candidatus Dormibacteraeota bacterium]|nr:histidine kinase [Candidatus Dormibacteraeota bacterium]